ncbi:tautomerase family protein [Pelagibius sp. Alg239-R121]|uniref:tautomerase family protein n=1 Tax=Pelagibius sp. Alg239-R121 TaxID=2993448 RepID=UPI0024A78657|nr:tautomerase family protein [Pelagibius sp. Alg239-R121]
MPVITVTLIEGYDEATRERLAKGLTQVAQTVIGAPLDGVTVALHELKPANYMRGGRQRTPGKAPTPPSTIVQSYLTAMEARDLKAASQWLAKDACLTFPGGKTFTTLDTMIAWAQTRYRHIAKSYERFDEAGTEDGAVVICQGTLHGEWLNGVGFDGIRFVDWFLIRDEMIMEQKVWNDLAETILNPAKG